MYLHQLKLANFKNIEEAEITFSDKINCFIGLNGAGKTNILDSIYYLSFCKSYFNPIDSLNIKHDSSFFAIHGNYFKNGEGNYEISCVQKRNHKKQFKLNDKEYDRFSDHIGLFPLVMISPYDRDLINEGSDVRRKFIDTVISQFDKFYLSDLIYYNKALQQRNSLLKSFAERNYFDFTALEIWNVQLISSGQKIFEKRKNFLTEFIPLFQQYFNYISGGREKVSISYDSQLNQRSLEELFVSSLEKDRILKYTTVGTHKDDLLMGINDHAVKKFGSQGQQKSYIIAIKLAQFEFTKKKIDFRPVLLLDDIFDKLDEDRVKQIIELVGDDNFGQVFITDTQKERIMHIFEKVKIEHKIFKIDSGNAMELINE